MSNHAVPNDLRALLKAATTALAESPQRFALRGAVCLVIGISACAVNFEPTGGEHSAQFTLARTAAAAEAGATPSLRAAAKGTVAEKEHAEFWRVVAATGPSHYRYADLDPLSWRAVTVGLRIESYAEITTGSGGQLELFNGRDRMTLAPNSTVALPDAAPGAPDITILQTAGEVQYDVESRQRSKGLLSRIGRLFLAGHRPTEHFEVRTPLLIAVVKGTTFTVVVSAGDSVVDVEIGLVQVTPTRGGRSVNVNAGKRATVNPRRSDAVSVGDGSPQGGDSQGGDSQGGDSQGGGSQGGDSQGGDSQGGDSQGGDSQDGDSQGGDSQGGNAQGNQQ